jgi:cell division protein ZapD
LKDLERQRNYLTNLRTDESVDNNTLETVISQIESCLNTLNSLIGRPNTLINENEWLSFIRSRLSAPGATSPVDLPSLYCWQQTSVEERRALLESYTPAFNGWRETCHLFLKLLRQSGVPSVMSSSDGFFQMPPAGKLFQLIRVGIENHSLIPEISANKHVLSIRFLENSTTGKPPAYTKSLDFELTFCNL